MLYVANGRTGHRAIRTLPLTVYVGWVPTSGRCRTWEQARGGDPGTALRRGPKGREAPRASRDGRIHPRAAERGVGRRIHGTRGESWRSSPSPPLALLDRTSVACAARALACSCCPSKPAEGARDGATHPSVPDTKSSGVPKAFFGLLGEKGRALGEFTVVCNDGSSFQKKKGFRVFFITDDSHYYLWCFFLRFSL